MEASSPSPSRSMNKTNNQIETKGTDFRDNSQTTTNHHPPSPLPLLTEPELLHPEPSSSLASTMGSRPSNPCRAEHPPPSILPLFIKPAHLHPGPSSSLEGVNPPSPIPLPAESEPTSSKQTPPPPPPNLYQRVLTSKPWENPAKSPILDNIPPRTGRDKDPPALRKSLPLGSLYSNKPPPPLPSHYSPLLAEPKPACHYKPLSSLKTSLALSHKRLHGYLGASPKEETLLREKLLTTNMESRSLRATSPARSSWTRPPPPPLPTGPCSPCTSPPASPSGPAGKGSRRDQASDMPPVEQSREKPEKSENYEQDLNIPKNIPPAGATGPPPPSTDRERPCSPCTSPPTSLPGPAGTGSSRDQASDMPPVEQSREKPEKRENYKPNLIITDNTHSAGATGPPPSSTDRERPPSPATQGLGTPGGPAAPSSRRGCSKQLNSNLFENAALQFRKCEKNKDHIKDDAGDILQSEYWRTRAHKKRWEENGMSGGADLRMKQAGAELSETNNKNWVEGGGNSASTKATKTTKMATGARITTTEETKQPGNTTIK